MPDWRALVGARVSAIGLDPIAELDLTEEVAQHLEDRYEYLRAQDWTDAEAEKLCLAELDDEAFIQGLTDILSDS